MALPMQWRGRRGGPDCPARRCTGRSGLFLFSIINRGMLRLRLVNYVGQYPKSMAYLDCWSVERRGCPEVDETRPALVRPTSNSLLLHASVSTVGFPRVVFGLASLFWSSTRGLRGATRSRSRDFPRTVPRSVVNMDVILKLKSLWALIVVGRRNPCLTRVSSLQATGQGRRGLLNTARTRNTCRVTAACVDNSKCSRTHVFTAKTQLGFSYVVKSRHQEIVG